MERLLRWTWGANVRIQRLRIQGFQGHRPFSQLSGPADRWISITGGGLRVWVQVPGGWIRALVRGIWGGESDNGFPHPMDEGVALWALADMVDQLGKKTSVSWQITGWASPDEADAMTRETEAWVVIETRWTDETNVWCTHLLIALTELPGEVCPQVDALRWPVEVHCAYGSVRWRDLGQLVPGDVFVPDVWSATTWADCGRVNPEAEVVWIRTGGSWHRGLFEVSEEHWMVQMETLWTSSPYGGLTMGIQGNSANWEDLEVGITVEIARMAVPLREIRNWTVGTCLTLPRRLDDPVRLVIDTGAERRCLAEGRAVVVDGYLGVEITRIFSFMGDHSNDGTA